jgi:hypothetical protein
MIHRTDARMRRRVWKTDVSIATVIDEKIKENLYKIQEGHYTTSFPVTVIATQRDTVRYAIQPRYRIAVYPAHSNKQSDEAKPSSRKVAMPVPVPGAFMTNETICCPK